MKKWKEAVEVKKRRPRRTTNRPGRGMLATFDDEMYLDHYESYEINEINEKYERV